jgi:hypothetical protein
MFVTRTDQSIRVGSAKARVSRFFVGPSLSVYQVEEIELIGKNNVRRVCIGSNGQVMSAPATNEDNGRFADYFIHLLLGVKLRDALVRSTIWIQRI